MRLPTRHFCGNCGQLQPWKSVDLWKTQITGLVIMERPTPNSQDVGYAANSTRSRLDRLRGLGALKAFDTVPFSQDAGRLYLKGRNLGGTIQFRHIRSQMEQYVEPSGRTVKKHLAATKTLEPFLPTCHRHFILSAAFRFLMAYSMSSLSP
jgi:hypothetical protein